MKCLKKDLRRLNKRHYSGILERVKEQGARYSGISERVKEQGERVEVLQWVLLTNPNRATAVEEHRERDKLNKLLTAEQKFYRQRSRVRWADIGDRNTSFYHKTVDQRVTQNHIHFLRDENESFIGTNSGIKDHSAAYLQRILGHTDMPTSPVNVDTL